jgi:hypothetical protein
MQISDHFGRNVPLMTTAPGSRAAEMPRKSSRPAIVVMQVIGDMQRIIQTSNSPPDGPAVVVRLSRISVKSDTSSSADYSSYP